MSYLLVVTLTPMAIWAVDRCLYRGEFTGLVREALNLERRPPRRKATKGPRIRITVAK